MTKLSIREPKTIDTDEEVEAFSDDSSDGFFNFSSIASSNFEKTLKSHENQYDLKERIDDLSEKHKEKWRTIQSDDTFKEKAQRKMRKSTTTKLREEGVTLIEDSEGRPFHTFGLSKALTKAIGDVGYVNSTPIQSEAIPLILQGRDVLACAKTGSGKSAAYLLPILERLLRVKSVNFTRVLVMLPTRELALQVYQVLEGFSRYTPLRLALATGGQLTKTQEVQLRKCPDVIIATPGRLIDHLHNCPSFDLKDVEVLVLDEADRLLDDNFKEQLEEVVRLSSKTRQTLLFSATMNSGVEELGKMSLKNPAKLFVDSNVSTVSSLKQEFVQIKDKDEALRYVYVAALVCRNFQERCLVFCETKRQTHRLRIILGLLGVSVTELHGDLTQLQRYEALNAFKEERVGVLVATNLAARGLDIAGIETDYIHRVGRTARAGRNGLSVTVVAENDRKLLKAVAKSTPNKLQMRIVPEGVISALGEVIRNLEPDVCQLLKEEKEAKEVADSESLLTRAQNKIVHEKEILSRPRRQFMHKPKKSGVSKEVTRTKKLPKKPPGVPYASIKNAKRAQKAGRLKQDSQLKPKKAKKSTHRTIVRNTQFFNKKKR